MFTNSMLVMAAAEVQAEAYQVIILGFSTVFVGLLCLIAIISLMGKIMAAQNAKAEAKAAAAPVAAAPVQAAQAQPEEGDRGSMIAAISAAIATVMGKDVAGIRIHSVKKID